MTALQIHTSPKSLAAPVSDTQKRT